MKIGDEERKYGVQYTEYVDLTPFESEDLVLEYYEDAYRLSSSDDWKEHYFSIDKLRKLNKYAPEVLEEKLIEVFPFLDSWINSPRTYLGKNALMFIQEIYMQPRSAEMIEFTRQIVPTLEIKTAHESAFLRNESQIALQFWSANMAYPEVIEIIWEGCESKNTYVKNFSWKALLTSIQNWDKQYFQYPTKFTVLFETLSKGLIASKSVEEKDARKILKHIGKEQSLAICKEVFSEEEAHKAKRIHLAFQEKKKKAVTSGGFRKFMKKMKQQSDSTPNDSSTVPITIN